jgi:hypothetical protein
MLIPQCVIHGLLEQIPSNHELLVSMKLELTLFISYAEAYGKVFNSIFWNGSNTATKNRVKAKLNRLAFDAVSSFIDATNLFNEYCSEMDKQQIIPPRWAESVTPNLNTAMEYLKKYHGHQINSIQLSLFGK